MSLCTRTLCNMYGKARQGTAKQGVEKMCYSVSTNSDPRSGPSSTEIQPISRTHGACGLYCQKKQKKHQFITVWIQAVTNTTDGKYRNTYFTNSMAYSNFEKKKPHKNFNVCDLIKNCWPNASHRKHIVNKHGCVRYNVPLIPDSVQLDEVSLYKRIHRAGG